jgi:hypothetical protein
MSEGTKRFESFISDCNIPFIKNNKIFTFNNNFVKWANEVYTLFLDENGINKINVCLIEQKFRSKSEKYPQGVINVFYYLAHDSLPPIVRANTLICSYSEEYKDLWFKPYTFFNSYINKLKVILTNKQWRSVNNSVPITSDRKLVSVYEPEDIKGSKIAPVRKEKKIIGTKWETVEQKNTHIGGMTIENKIPYVITEKEMKESLLKHSERIEPTFKLKIKLLSKQIDGFNINNY